MRRTLCTSAAILVLLAGAGCATESLSSSQSPSHTQPQGYTLVGYDSLGGTLYRNTPSAAGYTRADRRQAPPTATAGVNTGD